jgi:hypothetical protein
MEGASGTENCEPNTYILIPSFLLPYIPPSVSHMNQISLYLFLYQDAITSEAKKKEEGITKPIHASILSKINLNNNQKAGLSFAPRHGHKVCICKAHAKLVLSLSLSLSILFFPFFLCHFLSSILLSLPLNLLPLFLPPTHKHTLTHTNTHTSP